MMASPNMLWADIACLILMCRHRLFVDNVKRTRSTVWLKKDGKKFVPVTSKHDRQ